MIRVLQTFALALLVLGLSGRAAVAAKPTVVILGLEVLADKSGNIDQQTVQVARDFTTQLRSRAIAAGQLIPHSDKELVDEKLIRNCTNAEATCIAPIGQEFSATYLIYGSVEKTGTGFKISLHMLNVATKTSAKNFALDLKDTNAIGLSDGGKSAYAGLLGGDPGMLNINIQNDGVDGGSVTVGKDKHPLSGGHLTVKDLGPDRYTIVVEVTGFQRYEQTVALAQGEKKEVVVTLVPVAGIKVTPPKCPEGSLECTNTVSHTNNHTGYKVVGYSALVLSAAAAGYALHTPKAVTRYQDPSTGIAPTIPSGAAGPMSNMQYTDSDCGNSAVRTYKGENSTGNQQFDAACSARQKQVIAAIVSGAAAGIAVVALIMAYRSSDDQPEKHAQMGHRKSPKPLIAITPILSPDGGGATLRIDF